MRIGAANRFLEKVAGPLSERSLEDLPNELADRNTALTGALLELSEVGGRVRCRRERRAYRVSLGLKDVERGAVDRFRHRALECMMRSPTGERVCGSRPCDRACCR